MRHVFQCNGEYFIFDVESASLHQIDKVVYDYLNGKQTDPTVAKEIQKEIDCLIEQGDLDATSPCVTPAKDTGEVKALCLHLSHDCNLRCKYCFAGQGTYHGQRMNMPLNVAKAAIDFLIENSGHRHNLEVDFFGGEPLMNFEVLKQVVEYTKEQGKKFNKNFKLTTTTNGVLLSREVSDYLNENMDNVVLSLDGRKEVNDAVRPTANGKGSWDLIVDKFKYFRSIRGDKSYYLRGTFTHNNLDFSKDILAMNDLGFDQISMEPVVLPKDSPLALTEEDLPTIFDQYESLAREYVNRRLDKEKWFSFFHFVVELENGPCYKKRLVGCGAGCEYLAVTPDGSIYPCHQFAGEKDYLLGNVFDKRLNPDVRKIFSDSNLLTKENCRNCFAKYQCSGGCSANAVHFNGDINKPYALACEMMRKRLECALYVYAKEHSEND